MQSMENKHRSPGWFFNFRAMAALLAALFVGSTTTLSAQVPSTGAEGGMLPTVSSTYTLAPYDVVDVSIFGEEDLHTRAKLGADGTVILPLIQSVSLSGKTVAEATDLIQKKYAAGFVKDPHVLLTVLEYKRITFSILGQVEKPGIYEIPEGTHMSVVDAILMAGGFTRIAAQNSVRVKRMVRGKAEVIKVHAGSMADEAGVAPFEILPGDVIKVPESWF
jgi:protein involved in polysaccharide export with SLBB domain